MPTYIGNAFFARQGLEDSIFHLHFAVVIAYADEALSNLLTYVLTFISAMTNLGSKK